VVVTGWKYPESRVTRPPGPLLRALRITQSLIRRVEQSRRMARASAHELSFAV